jgi:hypothetical protein
MGRIRKEPTDIMAVGKKIERQIIWNIAVYIRLSKEDGNDESESVINQKKILREYLEHFFEGQYVIIDYYIDDGLTGTDDTRENFMRMIQDIEQGKISCVICKTLSRAFRNYSDQGYYLEYYFQQKKIRFISTGDPKIDTYLNPEVITGLEVPIAGLMNDRFAARTSSDIRRTFATKRRNGEFIGAFPPYGYLKDPNDKNHLILDKEIVPVKRDILSWIIADGMSLNGAAHKLNDLGIPNPTAYKQSKGWNYHNPHSKENDGLWTGSTVRRMLLDKVNLGHMIQGKQRVVSYKVHDVVSVPKEEWFVKENTHEATFTQEEYDTLTRLLQRDTRTKNGERKLHLFSGFLRCYDCHKALQRSSAKNRTYYACRTYKEKSTKKCTKHSIREDILESAVLAAIKAQIALLGSLHEIVDEINQSESVNTQSIRLKKMLTDKNKELEKVQTILDGLYMDWKWGELPYERYTRMKAKCEEQVAGLEAVITNLKEEQNRIGQSIDSSNEVFDVFLKHQNIVKLDRGILINLVNTIYIHENKEITIEFRFHDKIRRITEIMELNREKLKKSHPDIFLPEVSDK